jgi:ribonuclease HI
MDAELIAAYQALKDLQNQGLQGKEIRIFIDSQTALKRLKKISLVSQAPLFTQYAMNAVLKSPLITCLLSILVYITAH